MDGSDERIDYSYSLNDPLQIFLNDENNSNEDYLMVEEHVPFVTDSLISNVWNIQKILLLKQMNQIVTNGHIVI